VNRLSVIISCSEWTHQLGIRIVLRQLLQFGNGIDLNCVCSMQEIGGHDNGDRRLPVAAISNEGVQLVIK
jgi:hypothetical protein